MALVIPGVGYTTNYPTPTVPDQVTYPEPIGPSTKGTGIGKPARRSAPNRNKTTSFLGSYRSNLNNLRESRKSRRSNNPKRSLFNRDYNQIDRALYS